MLAQHGRHALADEQGQTEIVTQWDMIERDLHLDSFWAFLTNKHAAAYPTRIEFLFDLIAKKPDGDKDRLFTFPHFKRLLEEKLAGDAKKL